MTVDVEIGDGSTHPFADRPQKAIAHGIIDSHNTRQECGITRLNYFQLRFDGGFHCNIVRQS